MEHLDFTLYRPSYPSVRLIQCSPPSWMVEIALREKKLPFAVHELSFERGEHRTPKMLALNPRGTIPVLTHGQAVLSESLAMLEHLDDVHPDPPLLGRDLVARARARNRLHEFASLKSTGMSLFAYLMRTSAAHRDARELAPRVAGFRRELERWDSYYRDDTWAAGESLSLADIAVYTYVATASRLGWPVQEELPNLAGLCESMGARGSVRSTWPWLGEPEETPLAKASG